MGAVTVDWSTAEVLDVAPSALATSPDAGVGFASLPKAAATAKNYPAWQKAFTSWVSSAQRLELWRHAALQLTSKPGESERDFRIRVQTAQREARDAAVEQIRQKFAAKRAVLEEKLRKAEQSVTREQQQVTSSGVQTAVSIGATVIGALFGRKAISAGTIGRATTAARGIGRSAKEYEDVRLAQQNVDAVKKALDDMDTQIADETKDIASRYDADATSREGRPRTQARPGRRAVRHVGVEGEITGSRGSRAQVLGCGSGFQVLAFRQAEPGNPRTRNQNPRT